MQFMYFERLLSTFTEDWVILQGVREGVLKSFNSPGSFGFCDLSAGIAVRGRVSLTNMQKVCFIRVTACVQSPGSLKEP